MNEQHSAGSTDSNDVPFPSWEAWNRIRNGALLPCLEEDRDLYDSQKQFAASHVKHTSCVECNERFSDGNCFTQAGWEETQISGLCESCFDEITAEPEDEEPEYPVPPEEAYDVSRWKS